MKMFNDRFRVEGPDWDYHTISYGHGGDEYGNCTLYFRCLLFGVTWWYPTGHYQTEVELTEPGIDKWVDKNFYGGCGEYCQHSVD